MRREPQTTGNIPKKCLKLLENTKILSKVDSNHYIYIMYIMYIYVSQRYKIYIEKIIENLTVLEVAVFIVLSWGRN